jgi:hypothetical protein
MLRILFCAVRLWLVQRHAKFYIMIFSAFSANSAVNYDNR